MTVPRKAGLPSFWAGLEATEEAERDEDEPEADGRHRHSGKLNRMSHMAPLKPIAVDHNAHGHREHEHQRGRHEDARTVAVLRPLGRWLGPLSQAAPRPWALPP